nr:immunoglobulin light chain junction region [Macaca mulatta]MOX23863.1 immunoglobulin light chain junction region [Macaca mulatta]MOX23907.1 immunoglobulin light chain junction region [Macaca mulatta]MOX23914.1 immunoglobulin light chain junction region [Macaca mulatta]MOX23999.1 immunoglobulin light chain junction region [Macaca mulatta]
CLQGFRTPFTF